jgi:hypothetical protein
MLPATPKYHHPRTALTFRYKVALVRYLRQASPLGGLLRFVTPLAVQTVQQPRIINTAQVCELHHIHNFAASLVM